MTEPLVLKVRPEDNVAVAVRALPAGTEALPGVAVRQEIPQAHKIALRDLAAGEAVVRYGVVLGYARDAIPAGSWIGEDMLSLPQPPGLDELPYGTDIRPVSGLPEPTRSTWMGYRNRTGPAGTRNLLGIVTTVQCAAGVVEAAAERIKRELLPQYPPVEGGVARRGRVGGIV